jgi:hypothetical protein
MLEDSTLPSASVEFNYSTPTSTILEDSAQPSAPVEFNYSTPVISSDGPVLFKPNFPSSGPKNPTLAIRKNSEIPLVLKAAGHLTAEEEIACQYHRIKDQEKIYVGDEQKSGYNGTWLNEKTISIEIPNAWEATEKVRKIVLQKDEVYPEESMFERLITGKKAKPASRQTQQPVRRDHKFGFTCNPQQTVSINFLCPICVMSIYVPITARGILKRSHFTPLF